MEPAEERDDLRGVGRWRPVPVQERIEDAEELQQPPLDGLQLAHGLSRQLPSAELVRPTRDRQGDRASLQRPRQGGMPPGRSHGGPRGGPFRSKIQGGIGSIQGFTPMSSASLLSCWFKPSINLLIALMISCFFLGSGMELIAFFNASIAGLTGSGAMFPSSKPPHSRPSSRYSGEFMLA